MQATLGAWLPYERNHHISRRQRWVRKRVRDRDSKAMEKKKVRLLTNHQERRGKNSRQKIKERSCFIYQSGYSALIVAQ